MHRAIHRFDRLPYVEPAPTAQIGRAAAPVRKTPLVGLIRNPRSHRNGGSRFESLPGNGPGARPAPGPNVIVRAPAQRGELAGILGDFARQRVDYIAIDGGDGTVRDVLTCGARTFGESWPALIVLPHGKTNALAHDLAIPKSWTLEAALEAARRDALAVRRPLVVAGHGDPEAQVFGFVFGGGAFTSAVALGQNAHHLGAFDAAVVGVTTVWGMLQALFGGARNPWRQGTKMRLAYPGVEEVPHRGGGPASERYFVFASTLERMPAGLRPFGAAQGRLRLALLDNARRALLLRLPLIVTGRAGAGTQSLGYHSFGLDAVDVEIGDRFILDGEAFPAGSYRLGLGPKLRFVVP